MPPYTSVKTPEVKVSIWNEFTSSAGAQRPVLKFGLENALQLKLSNIEPGQYLDGRPRPFSDNV